MGIASPNNAERTCTVALWFMKSVLRVTIAKRETRCIHPFSLLLSDIFLLLMYGVFLYSLQT